LHFVLLFPITRFRSGVENTRAMIEGKKGGKGGEKKKRGGERGPSVLV